MDAKTLAKMTLPKLREEALKFGDITGVHGMKKAELLAVLKEKFGIVEEHVESENLLEKKHALKKKIRQLKTEQTQARAEKDKQKSALLRERLRRQRRILRKVVTKRDAHEKAKSAKSAKSA